MFGHRIHFAARQNVAIQQIHDFRSSNLIEKCFESFGWYTWGELGFKAFECESRRKFGFIQFDSFSQKVIYHGFFS
jgi:hypothetical protein